MRLEIFEVAAQILPLAEAHGRTPTQFALAWVLANPIVTTAVLGPRTMEQFEDNLGALDCDIEVSALDRIDELVAPATHTGHAFDDPQRPVLGRPRI